MNHPVANFVSSINRRAFFARHKNLVRRLPKPKQDIFHARTLQRIASENFRPVLNDAGVPIDLMKEFPKSIERNKIAHAAIRRLAIKNNKGLPEYENGYLSKAIGDFIGKKALGGAKVTKYAGGNKVRRIMKDIMGQ